MKAEAPAKLSKWHWASFGLLILITFAVSILVSIITAEEPPSKLVDTKWLVANLSMRDLRIVDIRDNVRDYWEGHIPGAVYLSSDTLRWPDQGVPGKLMPLGALASLLGEMGINNKTAIVIYAEESNYKPTYLVWALDYLGHSDSMVLDGGFSKWKSEGRPITQDYPKIKAKQYSLQKPNAATRATLDEVKEIVNKGGAVLLDVRPTDLYTGEKGSWKRKGHIKGAINHFWADDLKSDGTWKSKDELKKAYEKLGATPDKNIIVSCGQGLMSAHSYFTLKYILGYPKVKNYDGSFNEWSNIGELPVETGVGPAASMPMDGRKLLAERCTRCHDLKSVDKEKADKAKWEKIIARMVKKGATLNEAESKFLIEYLSSR